MGEDSAGAGSLLSGSVHEITNRIYTLVVQYGMNFIGALAIFFVGRWVAKSVSWLLRKTLTRAKVDATLVPFIDNLAYTDVKENGMTIPFTQQEITIKTAASAAGLLKSA